MLHTFKLLKRIFNLKLINCLHKIWHKCILDLDYSKYDSFNFVNLGSAKYENFLLTFFKNLNY